jgi:hypothetical protein
VSVSSTDILDGVVIIGSQFNEPMRVVGNPTAGDGFVLVNLVGTRTSNFRNGVTLTKTDLGSIQIERKEAVFGGKPRLFKLGLEALTAADREVPLGGDPDATEPEKRGFLAYVFETLSKEALRQVLGGAETEGFEEDARMTALFLWTLQSTKPVGNGDKQPQITDNDEDEPSDDEDEQKAKKAKAGFSMPFDTFIRITRPMGIHYPALEGRVIDIEKGIVRLLPVRERSEQLLGEAATRPGAVISLEDVQQMELGLVTKRQNDSALPSKPKRGQKAKAVPGQAQEEATFTALDRIHRAMLLFGLGRSTLLRQVLEKELRQSKRFERLALSLNALYPDGSDERRMLEGVQAAMRGIR